MNFFFYIYILRARFTQFTQVASCPKVTCRHGNSGFLLLPINLYKCLTTAAEKFPTFSMLKQIQILVIPYNSEFVLLAIEISY